MSTTTHTDTITRQGSVAHETPDIGFDMMCDFGIDFMMCDFDVTVDMGNADTTNTQETDAIYTPEFEAIYAPEFETIYAPKFEIIRAPEFEAIYAPEFETIHAPDFDDMIYAPEFETICATEFETIYAPEFETIHTPELDAIDVLKTDAMDGVEGGDEDAKDDEPFPYYLEIKNIRGPIESITNYGPGGFHPVKLGDCLIGGGRFRVLHKLGAGGWGAVWLCRDKLSGELRALKINAAFNSTPDCIDLKMAEIFKAYTCEELLLTGVSLPSEFFWLNGPNGRHLCSVSPFLGPNLSNITDVYGFCRQLLKDICFRLALAMRFIHWRGVVHGDYRPDNICFQLAPGVERWTDAEVYANLGEPELIQVIKTTDGEFDAGVPEQLVARAKFHYGNGFCSTRIAVVDFGVAYKVVAAPDSSGIPLPYAPPEDIFITNQMGFASDIFSLACTISEICLGRVPFGRQEEPLPHIREMEKVLGPLPQIYHGSYRGDFEGEFANDPEDSSLPVTMSAKWFKADRDGRQARWGNPSVLWTKVNVYPIITTINAETQAKLESHNHRGTEVLPLYSEGEDTVYSCGVRGPLSKEDGEALFEFLRGILKWLPEERPSIHMILRHTWFERRILSIGQSI